MHSRTENPARATLHPKYKPLIAKLNSGTFRNKRLASMYRRRE
jgi:hypothetical protein